jgi:hypothetical protein
MNYNLYFANYISARYADDAGHKKFTEEVYELQYRIIAGAQWQPKAIGWTDLVRKIITNVSFEHSLCLFIGWG